MTRTQRIRELLAIGNDTHTIAEKLEREYGPTSRANMRALISYARRNPPGTRGRPRKAPCTHCGGSGHEPQVTP